LRLTFIRQVAGVVKLQRPCGVSQSYINVIGQTSSVARALSDRASRGQRSISTSFNPTPSHIQDGSDTSPQRRLSPLVSSNIQISTICIPGSSPQLLFIPHLRRIRDRAQSCGTQHNHLIHNSETYYYDLISAEASYNIHPATNSNPPIPRQRAPSPHVPQHDRRISCSQRPEAAVPHRRS
jgi:hypothetical protein